MARVLLVDTNFSSMPLYNALISMGHEVHVCGANPKDALAQHSPHYHAIDYADSKALANLVDTLRIDHVVPGCNDRSYLSCTQAKALTLFQRDAFAGLDSTEQSLLINDKQQFRRHAQQLGLTSPRFHGLDDATPNTPVIVKPSDSFSGQGISVIRQPTEKLIAQARALAARHSASGQTVVEDWIEGQLYSHSAFLLNQRIVQAHVVIEHCSAYPYAVDTSHLAPEDLPANALVTLTHELERLAQSLSLGDGLLHTQFVWDGQQCWLIELTRRCPGDLYSQLIELSTGPGYVGQYLAPFLGQALEPQAQQGPHRHILRHTLTTESPSTLEHVSIEVPIQIERWVPIATVGHSLQKAPKGRIAILFANANDTEGLKSLAERATTRTLFRLNAK